MTKCRWCSSPAAWLFLGLFLLHSGCGLWQPSALSKCEAEKKRTWSRLLAHQRELDELRNERELLSQRVADAERQLALVHDHSTKDPATYERVPDRVADGRRTGLDERGASRTDRFQRDAAIPNEWTPRQRRE